MSDNTNSNQQEDKLASVQTLDDLAGLLAEEEDALLGGGDQDEDQDDLNDDDLDTDEGEGDDSEEDEEGIASDDSDDEEGTWEAVLGLPEDQLELSEDGTLKGVKMKVDGKDMVVPMSELVTGFNTNKHVTQKSQALSEEKRVFEEQRTEVASTYSQQLENVNALAKYLENQINSDYEGVDWERLRAENPGEFAAAMQDREMRLNHLRQAQEAIGKDREKHNEKLQKHFLEQQQATLRQEFDKMVANNPAWIDENVRQKEMGTLNSFAIEAYGFSEQDMNNIRDARVIEVIKDAQKFREGAKFVKQKRQAKVPKFEKSKGGKVRKGSRLERLTKKAKTTTGAEQRGAQVDAIAELIS